MARQDIRNDRRGTARGAGPAKEFDGVDAGPRQWPRVSASATGGLILAIVALCATLTGLLAPEGFALAVISVMLSIAGMIAASRPAVTGHSLAILGVLAGLTAMVLAVLAMTNQFLWPNANTDEVARLHDWLIARWPWLNG